MGHLTNLLADVIITLFIIKEAANGRFKVILINGSDFQLSTENDNLEGN